MQRLQVHVVGSTGAVTARDVEQRTGRGAVERVDPARVRDLSQRVGHPEEVEDDQARQHDGDHGRGSITKASGALGASEDPQRSEAGQEREREHRRHQKAVGDAQRLHERDALHEGEGERNSAVGTGDAQLRTQGENQVDTEPAAPEADREAAHAHRPGNSWRARPSPATEHDPGDGQGNGNDSDVGGESDGLVRTPTVRREPVK